MPPDRAPLKIGYVVETFPSPSETFIANEIKGVAACGADLTVFAVRRGPGGIPVPAEVVYLPSRAQAAAMAALLGVPVAGRPAARLARGLGGPAFAPKLAAEAARRGITHLHAHFALLPTTLALTVARSEPVSVSFAAHARDVYAQRRGLGRKLHEARLCIACTEAVAGVLRGLVAGGEQDKVMRVYHGTDLQQFIFRPRERVGDPPRILAVGRFVPKKGFETLLHACAALSERQRVACEIIGGGQNARKLRALRRELGLEGVVAFPGWAAYEAMPQVYEGADVVVVPSVEAADGDMDGLPNVVVEAMAAGVPVVASAISGIPEAVHDGETGLLCPPGDALALAGAMERALTDAELRKHITEGARRLVEQEFDCRKNARRVYELIRQAAGR